MPSHTTKLVRSAPLIFKPEDWQRLGEGSYNRVYRSKWPLKLDPLSSYTGLWVVKFPKPDDAGAYSPFNGPIRGIRILSELYGQDERVPQAFIKRATEFDDALESSYGWAVPYIDGRQATDDEIAVELVNIYRNTRRIVVDAPAKKNFLTITNGDGSKGTYCIDVDYALRRTNSALSIADVGDPSSSEVYSLYQEFWADYGDRFPHTISTIITLLKLEADFDPDHTRDDVITPYVIDGLRHFRRLPGDGLTFNALLLNNLAFLEKSHIALDEYWYDVVHAYDSSGTAISSEALQNLIRFRELTEKLSCHSTFDMATALVPRQTLVTERDLRRIMMTCRQGETLLDAMAFVLDGVQPRFTDEDEVEPMSCDESEVEERKPLLQSQYGFFARPNRHTDVDALAAAEKDSEPQQDHTVIGWARMLLGSFLD